MANTLAAVGLSAALLAGTAAASSPRLAAAPGLVVSQSGRIYVAGQEVGRGTQPAWSPDGERLAFVRYGEIVVGNADGSGIRRLTRRAPGLHWPASSPAWSPDGSRIAFAGTRDLYAVDVETGALTRLTRSTRSWEGNRTPTYSPDGRRIAFSRSTDPFNTDIFVIDAAGGHLRRLTRTQATESKLGEEHGPAWSPDGRTIVFVGNRDGGSELYAIGADGRGERRLTRTPSPAYDEDAPRFSRDGTRILYAHDGRIATMRLDGTGVRELGLGTSADWR